MLNNEEWCEEQNYLLEALSDAHEIKVGAQQQEQEMPDGSIAMWDEMAKQWHPYKEMSAEEIALERGCIKYHSDKEEGLL